MEDQQTGGSGTSGNNGSHAGGSGKKPWAAFNIVEKGTKTYWNRVGTAYHNRDGSMNLYLDALPRDGKVQLREDDRAERRDKERGALAEQAQAEA
jgi:hypothetical protein